MKNVNGESRSSVLYVCLECGWVGEEIDTLRTWPENLQAHPTDSFCPKCTKLLKKESYIDQEIEKYTKAKALLKEYKNEKR